MTATVYALHRVEPISREGDPGRGLAAPVHDPLWGLARQRQFGELAGEDTGSPVQIEYVLQTDALDGWSSHAAGTPDPPDVLPYDPRRQVVEALVAGESSAPAHSLRDRVDAGRRLRAGIPEALGADLMARFPIDLSAYVDTAPPFASRAAALFADGLAVAAAVSVAAGASDAELATALGTSAGRVTVSRSGLESFAQWCVGTFGIGPSTWVPERLERRFGLTVGGVPALAAPAHVRDVVDAADLDLTPGSAGIPTRPAPGPDEQPTRRIPTRLQFPGMPNDRFWEFEDAQLALHRIDAATHDLSRLALVEFSSTYGNDWFTFPVAMPYGVVATLPDVVVTDTFGGHEMLSVADDQSWSMFVPTREAVSPSRLVVPSVTSSPLAGPVVEEVRFLRDENANLVWALEAVVTDPDGDRHDLVAEYSAAVMSASRLPTDAELLYRLMTDVPEHWVPFVPVQVDDTRRAVTLVEAVLPRPDSYGELVTVPPRSSILQELRGVPLHEEEVGPAGVTVRRRWYLARSADGGRHAWVARSVSTGRGEGSSGLAFDTTIDVRGR